VPVTAIPSVYGIEILGGLLAAQRRRTIAFLGDSRINQGIGIASGTSTVVETHGLQHWVPMLLKQDGQLISGTNFGVAGDTTVQVLARVGDVVAARPDICVVLCGTNDRAAGTDYSARRSLQTIRSIVAALRGAGILVCLLAEMPRGNATYSSMRLTGQALLNHYATRDGILAMAEPGVAVVNPWTVLQDTDSATPGDVLAGMTRDGMHQSTPGAYAMSRLVADAIRPWVIEASGRALLPTSNTEVWSAANPAGWINDNPMLTGTGGTKGTGMTGQLADGYSSNIAGGAAGLAVAASKYIDSLGREWQQFVVSGTPAGTAAVDLIRQTGLQARTAEADQLSAVCEVECIGVTNLRSVKVGVRSISGTDSFFTDGDEPTDIAALPADYSGILRSQPITLPSGVTDIQIRLVAYPIASAPVSGIVRVRALGAC